MATKSKKTALRKQPNAIQRFSRETIAELRKVSWPTRTEAISLTKVVIIVMLITGFMLGGLDYLFTRLFALILG